MCFGCCDSLIDDRRVLISVRRLSMSCKEVIGGNGRLKVSFQNLASLDSVR